MAIAVCERDKKSRWQVISLKDHWYAAIWSQALSTGKNPVSVDVLSEKNPMFAGLWGTRDTVARHFQEAGVGASVKHTESFTKEEGSMLWCKGILGNTSPKALLPAVSLPMGSICAYEGVRNTRSWNFQFGCEEGGEFVEYVENGSKNRSES